MFGPKRGEVAGEWRKLFNEEIKSRRMGLAGYVARMEEESVQYFGGKPRRKGPTWKTKA
jgi:hypothetical protein